MAQELVRVELSFVTEQDADQLSQRIRESVALIVGREALEDFRIRTMPLDPKRRDHLKPVD
jgi:hypothetical protein